MNAVPRGSATDDITQMLAAARSGDARAWDQLVTVVYADLRSLAHRHVAGQHGDRTLNTTGLVHECYIRLAQAGATPNDRNHFFGLASRVMRQVIIDHARERLAQKRGSGAATVPLDAVREDELAQARQFVAVEDALNELARTEPRQARVVECQFFAGYTEQETADAIGVSLRLVQQDWHEARHWLARFLAER
ncbi:MAG TPA: ECF-type sigma factor [Candidatus Saccharimonadia bacterium]|nr:ECF-type sigma factor [Candidatus Saccharimonadia bacterium]